LVLSFSSPLDAPIDYHIFLYGWIQAEKKHFEKHGFPSCHTPKNKPTMAKIKLKYPAAFPPYPSETLERSQRMGAGDGRDLHGTSSVHKGTRPHCQPAGGSKRWSGGDKMRTTMMVMMVMMVVVMGMVMILPLYINYIIGLIWSSIFYIVLSCSAFNVLTLPHPLRVFFCAEL
jgi:hypothetical protein